MRRSAGIAVVALLLAAASAAAQTNYRPISRIWIRAVVQPPYQVVSFKLDVNIAPSASVSQIFYATYKIWDGRGNAVYSPPKATTFTTSYHESELTLTWNKRGSDGLVVPPGTYYVKPLVEAYQPVTIRPSDGTATGGASQRVAGPLKVFVLRR